MFTSKAFLEGGKPAHAVNNAIMLGYLWAKAEFQSIGSPIVDSARTMAARSSVGGIKGAETRRRKSEEGWRLIAGEMAIKIRAEMPESSQDKVAGEIDTRWKVAEPKAPKPSDFEEIRRGAGAVRTAAKASARIDTEVLRIAT